MPCLRAYAMSWISTHDPLITSREHEPLHHSAPMHCIKVFYQFIWPITKWYHADVRLWIISSLSYWIILCIDFDKPFLIGQDHTMHYAARCWDQTSPIQPHIQHQPPVSRAGWLWDGDHTPSYTQGLGQYCCCLVTYMYWGGGGGAETFIGCLYIASSKISLLSPPPPI